ncbi:hypothetical protein CVCC1112_2912 [Paenarthrobacter nicotinovorans]|nr:hypothetical protein CVCC1112_2912 [Paenarthrobacter nicotinovorans]
MLIAALGIQPAAAFASSDEPLVTPADAGELSTTLKAAITERNQQVLVNPGTASQRLQLDRNYSSKSKAKISAEYDELKARKDRLAGFGQGFATVNTKFESESFLVTEGQATADVVEFTEMTYTTGGPPTSYRYEQIVEFTRTEAGWKIDAIKPKEASGLPPSTVVSNAQLKAASKAALIIGPGQTAKPAKTVAPSEHVPETKGKTASQNSGEISTMAGYDYGAMIAYARYWVYHRNGAYRSFGNDCQNFVSQSLNAGGWQHKDGWYLDDNNWWYNWANQTRSWINAQNFHNFAVGQGRVSYLSYLNDLGPADVLQVHWQDDPNVDHSMIVTYSPWSAGTRDIRVSYHTTDTLDRSIWDLYAQNPGAVWYGLRT